MSARAQARKMNGTGPAAKVAARRWVRRQFLAQGVYDGPLRLLALIVALGIPLACYSEVTTNAHTWWPLIVGASAPVLVLAISLLRHVLVKRNQPAPVRKAHPLTPLSKAADGCS
jgi:hypothetical protein